MKLQTSSVSERAGTTRTYQLPVELLELIVRSVSESDSSIALPASHRITKTLFACLFVSKATHATSLELLYQKCLYIDSPRRLRAAIRSYDAETPVHGRTTNSRQFRQAASTSIYLAPFSRDTIDEPQVVSAIESLFRLLAHCIRRLVIDMPLRSYYPDEPGGPGLRSTLRGAFLNLKAVEEFVSVRDELYLSTVTPTDYSIEPPVWSRWINLTRLALYNLDIQNDLDVTLNAMPKLRTLVLTRPDREEDLDAASINWNPTLHVAVVNTWRDHAAAYQCALRHDSTRPFGVGTATKHRTYRKLPSENFRPSSVVDVVCVDGKNPVKEPRTRSGQAVSTSTVGQRPIGNNWAAYDLRNTFNDIRVCQEWVKVNALHGTLWPELALNWPPKERSSMAQAVGGIISH